MREGGVRTRERLRAYNRSRAKPDETRFCHAPFRSLFFYFEGKAYACCDNLSYSYGAFPEKSIREIWFGERIRRLREHIERDDLSLGCGTCAHNLRIGSYANVKARFYDLAPPAETYPSRLELQLTNTCNLECAMCSAWSSSRIRRTRAGLGPIPDPYDETFVRQLDEFIPHLREVHFVGGEPFVIPIYLEIWERILRSNPGCKIIVQTNGTVLNDRVRALMERGRFSISVSLDALTKKTYEEIRRGAVLEDTLRNVEEFIRYAKTRGTYFGLTPCPMQNNWREMPRLLRFANRRDVHIVFQTVRFPRACSLFGFPDAELRRVHRRLALSLLRVPAFTRIQRSNLRNYRGLLHQLRYFYNDPEQRAAGSAFERREEEGLDRLRQKEGLQKSEARSGSGA